MKKLLVFTILLISHFSNAQSVGIGTTSPNSSSVLDLGPSGKPLVMPRLTNAQMDAVTGVAVGMIVYNTDQHQLFSYGRFRSNVVIGESSNKWQPISTGPRMLAWGVIDSFGTEISGSKTHFVTWDEVNLWYRLRLLEPHEYYKDSMLLMITPVGNGSWDQAVSTGEVIEGNDRLASIKFIDVSRVADNFSALNVRRRSNFHFVLYDLREDPY